MKKKKQQQLAARSAESERGRERETGKGREREKTKERKTKRPASALLQSLSGLRRRTAVNAVTPAGKKRSASAGALVRVKMESGERRTRRQTEA